MTNEFVQKQVPTPKTPKHADPQLLLDYRCHTPAIGTNYPPQVTQCMQRIAAMDVDTVLQHYGLLNEDQARNLHARATGELIDVCHVSLRYFKHIVVTAGKEIMVRCASPRQMPSPVCT